MPDKWKVAKIIPIHKKGDKLDFNNYRPISILPCASKIMERVVQKQLLQYLKSHSLLSRNQSGFRPKHSTLTALATVTDDWFHSIDKGEYTGTIFVDLQKAFDMVDHLILLSKLEDMGITGTELQWFKSYLSNRRIRTSVNNELSDERLITKGVPQGSILGTPVVHNLYKCHKLCFFLTAKLICTRMSQSYTILTKIQMLLKMS